MAAGAEGAAPAPRAAAPAPECAPEAGAASGEECAALARVLLALILECLGAPPGAPARRSVPWRRHGLRAWPPGACGARRAACGTRRRAAAAPCRGAGWRAEDAFRGQAVAGLLPKSHVSLGPRSRPARSKGAAAASAARELSMAEVDGVHFVGAPAHRMRRLLLQ